MAIDIFQALINVLCPTFDAAQRCQEFVLRRQAESGDIQALIFFLFFPTVFMVLFIYFLSNFIIRNDKPADKGLRLLAGVAILVFVILQGWYPVILPISQIWYLFVIILVGIWIFLRMLVGRTHEYGGAGKGGLPFAGEAVDYATRRTKGAITGEEKKLKRIIESRMQDLELTADKVNKIGKYQDVGTIMAEFRDQKKTVIEAIDNLEDFVKFGAIKPREIQGYWARLDEITGRVKKHSKQYGDGD
ncbi:MAG: hypothetical protein HY367_02645 [Candidatus Aenigmarchaeota archaeon]|nr:hypothetical protein [Candidatus Aenigmarchaeota archaeon]